MSSTYKTKQGDMWDLIAKTQLGSESGTAELIAANTKYIMYTVFPAGCELILPEYEVAVTANLPPWRS